MCTPACKCVHVCWCGGGWEVRARGSACACTHTLPFCASSPNCQARCAFLPPVTSMCVAKFLLTLFQARLGMQGCTAAHDSQTCSARAHSSHAPATTTCAAMAPHASCICCSCRAMSASAPWQARTCTAQGKQAGSAVACVRWEQGARRPASRL